MTGKQITTIKYLLLKLKNEMEVKKLSIKDVSELTGYHIKQVDILINKSHDCTYEYLFKTLVNICIDLGLFNIYFDENNIIN